MNEILDPIVNFSFGVIMISTAIICAAFSVKLVIELFKED